MAVFTEQEAHHSAEVCGGRLRATLTVRLRAAAPVLAQALRELLAAALCGLELRLHIRQLGGFGLHILPEVVIDLQSSVQRLERLSYPASRLGVQKCSG